MSRIDAYGREYEPEDVLSPEELADYYDHVRPGWRRRDPEPLPVRYAQAGAA